MDWTILCIADDPHALLLYRSVLELSGLRVLTTSSGEHGLELCDVCSVNCVVLDRPQDGSIIARKIGRRYPHLPIVVASDDAGIFRCSRNGPFGKRQQFFMRNTTARRRNQSPTAIRVITMTLPCWPKGRYGRTLWPTGIR